MISLIHNVTRFTDFLSYGVHTVAPREEGGSPPRVGSWWIQWNWSTRGRTGWVKEVSLSQLAEFPSQAWLHLNAPSRFQKELYGRVPGDWQTAHQLGSGNGVGERMDIFLSTPWPGHQRLGCGKHPLVCKFTKGRQEILEILGKNSNLSHTYLTLWSYLSLILQL